MVGSIQALGHDHGPSNPFGAPPAAMSGTPPPAPGSRWASNLTMHLPPAHERTQGFTCERALKIQAPLNSVWDAPIRTLKWLPERLSSTKEHTCQPFFKPHEGLTPASPPLLARF